MTTETSQLTLSEFQYALPDDRIARFPLPQRDASKLLVYRKGQISHEQFTDLPGLLPDNCFLVFNNTKVIPARLHFTKPTGANIELFLLNPFPNEQPLSLAMETTDSAVWQVMVGNRKRWKSQEILETIFSVAGQTITLSATWVDYEQSVIKLNWQPASLTFAEVIQRAGAIPLPPYLKREATDTDRETYQTVYSSQKGAVAAPTAGLHFTPVVLEKLDKKGIRVDYLTLHVGAGTFQPIKTEDVLQHHMHTEQVVYTRQNIQNLLANLNVIISVGTTSMRALESLYWMGVKISQNDPDPFHLNQHYAYEVHAHEQPTVEEALNAVLQYLTDQSLESVVAHTGIYITPGYVFKLCKGIITNFHQPGSTLILLVAALIGDDWKRVYDQALRQDYRFLSYGDSSLLLP